MKYNLSQKMYIIEAAAEYLISILVSGAFLATLTKRLGIPDSITGILSSVIALGCLFQLFSVFIQKNRVKPLVIFLSIANQLLFLSLYLIPLLKVNGTLKSVLFIAAIIFAYFLYNIAHPKKIAWLMSQVSDSQRGTFTANKEIVSLCVGMAFSFSMGALSDALLERGQVKSAFVTFALVIFALMAVHTLSMVFVAEKERDIIKKPSVMLTVKSIASNKKLLGVTIIFMLYNIATHAASPFYGTYLINELGFSLKAVTAMSVAGSLSRVAVSRFWGRFADRRSFAVMFKYASALLALAFLMVAFTTEKTAPVLFVLYYLLYGAALGGTNSGLINLVFDYCPQQTRADSLAVCQAASGLVGFLSTLALSPLVTAVQNSNNTVFGLPLYAQQLLSVIAALFSLLTIIYVNKAFKKES